MKLLVVFFGILAVASAKLRDLEITTAYRYHENVGIHEAARIKQAEEALDFDGSRIAGGRPSNLGDNPHLGGLIIALIDGRTSVCGSSLLSNTKAVTAAHCWTDGYILARQFTVVLGSTRLFSGGVRITTSNVVLHPQFKPTQSTSNDVAVITISRVNYNANIQPIALASGSNDYTGTYAVAAGYGYTSDYESGVPLDTIQRQVSLRVITNTECQRTYGWRIAHSNLCVNTQGGTSTCGGDSGGPLAVVSGNSKTLIGITSFGHVLGCTRGFPVAFTRVTSFNSWITGHM